MSTSNFKGFASLKTSGDLLGKLKYDYKRMLSNPYDAYAAFDFFVTAYHMLDWLHPIPTGKAAQKKNDEARSAEETGSILLQVCSHIANGVKHFQATRP